MKPTIYIAGPMRGRPDFNRAAFNAAAERLAAKGWQPINPVDIERIFPCVRDNGTVDDDGLSNLLEIERAFVRASDAIYLLNGWEKSEGAQLELREFLGPFGRNTHLESIGTPNAPWKD